MSSLIISFLERKKILTVIHCKSLYDIHTPPSCMSTEKYYKGDNSTADLIRDLFIFYSTIVPFDVVIFVCVFLVEIDSPGGSWSWIHVLKKWKNKRVVGKKEARLMLNIQPSFIPKFFQAIKPVK